MAEGSKGKSRRARKSKGTSKVEPTKQRTLRDMFGRVNGSSQDVSLAEEELSQVVEVSDTEPEPETLPSTPGDIQRRPISGASSQSPPNGGSEILALASQPPKKLFPIFDRSRNANVQKPADGNSHSLGDNGSLDEPQAKPSPVGVTERPRSPSIISVRDPTPEGLTRDVPIIIESTPGPEVKPIQAKSVYSIFARQPRATERSIPKTSQGPPAPYPGRDVQHLSDYPTSPLIPPRFPAREKHHPPTALAMTDFWKKIKKASSELEHDDGDDVDSVPKVSVISDIDADAYINTIPRGYQSCPSVSRVLLSAEEREHDCSSRVSQEQWADKWRPLQADQVIGNEHHALYLRDWLKALRLQDQTMRPTPTPSQGRSKKRKAGKNKKPDVVRHVKKRRGANSQEFVDDFFAPDDFEEDEPDYTTQSSDWDDFTFCQEQNERINGPGPSAASSRRSSPPMDVFGEWATQPYLAPQFGRKISNTILLSGPSGSGKTAAVYACAHELGWEVFEVYPGVGERSGTELNRLIGDVGRNHTVKVHHSPKKSAPRANFFEASGDNARPRRQSRRIMDSDDEQVDELDVISLATESSPDFQSLALPPEPELEPVVNQSVILIEEADILYQTDTNFWPALINIIKDCRRPVVLTCNDPALIPCQDLPLQRTLEFAVCEAKLAIPYLQGLSLAESCPVSIDDLDRVYNTFSQDLRKSIQHIQLLNQRSSGSTQNGHTASDDCPCSSPLTSCRTTPSDSPDSDSDQRHRVEAGILSRMAAHYDAMTLMDGCRPENILGHYFMDEPTPSAADELGYRVLRSRLDYDHVPVGPFNRRGGAMFAAATQHLEDFAPNITALLFSHTLDEAAERYLTRVGPVLRSFRSWRVPATDPALHLDYAPWIRCMVSVENRAAEALSQLESGSQRRRTRNSQRAEAQNWLSLNTTERDALTETSLESD